LEVFEEEIIAKCEGEIEELRSKIEFLKPESDELELKFEEAKKENDRFEQEQNERNENLNELQLALAQIKHNQEGCRRGVDDYKRLIEELEKKQASCDAEIGIEQEGLNVRISNFYSCLVISNFILNDFVWFKGDLEVY
jgi:chromosome segregation ATPase